ncbi:MAG: Helix-turn-helix, AraC protein [Candidatus Solibacter sp.]|nr:Helix-turn-helix, AraC protein [Candidatus Solibacter sp.]
MKETRGERFGLLAKTLKDTAYRWLSEPRWYLWEGGFLLIARAEGVVPAHAHHAIQIVVALDGMVAVCGEDNRWRRGPGIIVQPDVVHSFDCNGAMGAMLFVDPESNEGAWLHRALEQEIAVVPDARLASSVSELRTFIEQPIESMEVGDLIRHCVHALSPGAPPARRLDQRITNVLDSIRARDDLRVSLDEAAQLAFLSPSRFAHLFKDQVGLPYSRYMLWRKLTRAMVAIASERTIAAAAHAADFADAAHLTRTFYQMVGMAPSVLMRGKFAEIRSPFFGSNDNASAAAPVPGPPIR